MGRPPNLLPAKNMHTRFEHVRIRRADFPAAQTYDTTVRAMIAIGGASAPQSSQVLNRMINGRDPVNRQWLTLLSDKKVYDLPTIRAEDWYNLSDGDFCDKVDLHICHDPIGVLTACADAAPGLGLRLERTSPRWQQSDPPVAVLGVRHAERAIEVGVPRRPARPIHSVAAGDGLLLAGTLALPNHLEVLNIDNPDGQDPKVHVLTAFLDCADGPRPAGLFEIRKADGTAIPIGGTYQGLSRTFVVATAAPVARRWHPKSDGWVSVADLRDFVIGLLRVPETERQVFAADYRTLADTP